MHKGNTQGRRVTFTAVSGSVFTLSGTNSEPLQNLRRYYTFCVKFLQTW